MSFVVKRVIEEMLMQTNKRVFIPSGLVVGLTRAGLRDYTLERFQLCLGKALKLVRSSCL